MLIDKKPRKVCLITPNHIATNPRLVKEACALSKAGYRVHIVFTQHVWQLVAEDEKILNNNPDWTFSSLDWTGRSVKSKWHRLTSGLIQKLNARLSKVVQLNCSTKRVLNRNYGYQIRAAAAADADFFIAHNIGALAVAGDTAQQKKRGFAFDAEDYHRGEMLPSDLIKKIIKVEDRYLPKAGYISAASPLIAEKYKAFYHKEVVVINNTFSLTDGQNLNIVNKSAPLKMFWFSQSVGLNRGLQDVFAALKKIEKEDIEFHIYGHLTQVVQSELKKLEQALDFQFEPKIFFHGMVSPEKLLSEAHQYDIGFAIEPGFCENNRIALSNKIFTYLLAGNAIIFSDTPAQTQFYKTYPDVGMLYPSGNGAKLGEILLLYKSNRELLHQHKLASKHLFNSEMNWELGQIQLLLKIAEAMKKPNEI